LSPAKLKQARKMIGEKTPVTEVAQVLGVSRATLYRRVPELGEACRPVSPSSARVVESIFSEQA
jgi:transposase-like protein